MGLHQSSSVVLRRAAHHMGKSRSSAPSPYVENRSKPSRQGSRHREPCIHLRARRERQLPANVNRGARPAAAGFLERRHLHRHVDDGVSWPVEDTERSAEEARGVVRDKD